MFGASAPLKVPLYHSYFPSQLTLVLVSGGGSALLPAPLKGLTLDEKSELVRKLHAAGAPIQDVNAVRTFLSKVFSRSSKIFFFQFFCASS